jgi:5-methyltetrahydrofolate--homocysteine methyltransferase
VKGKERVRFSFPRQRRDRRLCLSDFFASRESGKIDVVAFHVVTMEIQSVRRRMNSLRLTLIANISNFTVYRYSSQKLWQSIGTLAFAKRWLFVAMMRQIFREFLIKATEDLATHLDIRPAPILNSRPNYANCSNQVVGGELSEEFQLHPEQIHLCRFCSSPKKEVLQRKLAVKVFTCAGQIVLKKHQSQSRDFLVGK